MVLFRYDRNDIHDHFICTRCGYVIDVARDKNVKKYINGNLVVDYEEIKYRGICTKCQREENL